MSKAPKPKRVVKYTRRFGPRFWVRRQEAARLAKAKAE